MFPTQSIKINRRTDGYTDDDGKWIPAEEKLVATADVDLQPLSGVERNTTLKTSYESTHLAFITMGAISFEDGYSSIRTGDILVDADEKRYTIVFSAVWQFHYELDLKEARPWN